MCNNNVVLLGKYIQLEFHGTYEPFIIYYSIRLSSRIFQDNSKLPNAYRQGHTHCEMSISPIHDQPLQPAYLPSTAPPPYSAEPLPPSANQVNTLGILEGDKYLEDVRAGAKRPENFGGAGGGCSDCSGCFCCFCILGN